MTAQRALSPDPALSNPMDALLETIEALSTARNAEDIAAVVRSGARRLTGADGVAVVLRDADRCHYLDEDAIAPLWKGSRFPMSACISGWAMLTGQTAVIPDIYLDERIPHDAYRPTFVKSLVMTPVRPADPIAAIGAYWATARDPTPHEVEALKAMARATATAFENVRLIASLEDALQRRDFLIHELDHRVKNSLATVQAIARQSLRSSASGEEFGSAFEARLRALSNTHELLSTHSWEPASLEALARAVLDPAFPDDSRLVVSGAPINLRPEGAVTLAMGLFELATNAMKYGALSSDRGTVRLTWSTPVEGEIRSFQLDWQEEGGPPVKPPTRRGIGSDLLTRGLPRAFGGEGSLDFAPEGVRYRLAAPLAGRLALA